MTILDYAGIKRPDQYRDRDLKPTSGVSAKDFLEGKGQSIREESEWSAFELFGNTYVMAGDYKAIRVRKGMWGDGQWHLYDNIKDPGETTPIEKDKPIKFKRMIAFYERYAKKNNIMPVDELWDPWGINDNKMKTKTHKE
jgi:arylsulfatase A-like enzyme